MKVTHKKLPTGWQYVLTLRALKSLLKTSSADVRSVEYSGAVKSTYGNFWIPAKFESRSVDDVLLFRLSFAGTPAKVLDATDKDWPEFTAECVLDFLKQCNDEIASTTRPGRGTIRISRFNADEDYKVEYDWEETDKRQTPLIQWW